MSAYEALDYIKTKRRIASPNPGFRAQLVQFQKEISEFQDVSGDNSLDINDGFIEGNQVTDTIKQLTNSLRLEANAK